MASLSIPNSFTNNTIADAVQVNQNFNAVSAHVNANLVNIDGSVKAGTSAIDNLAVTEAKIANNAVTEGKLASSVLNGVTRIYASTTDRDAAITSPVAGMMVYINSNDANEGLYAYDGANWRKGAGWNMPWGVVARAADVVSNSATATTSQVGLFSPLSFTPVPNRLYMVSGNFWPIPSDPNSDSILFANLVSNVYSQVVWQILPGVFGVTTSGRPRQTINFMFAPTVATTLNFNVNIGRFVGTGSVYNGAAMDNPSQLCIIDMGPFGAPA